MKNATFMPKVSAIAVSILLTACGGGGAGGGNGGSLYIESCSLGCSGGSGGSQVACSIDQVEINPEFVVLFSAPVDLQSVDNQSLQFQNATNGSVPAFEYALDPLNPRRLIARPVLSTDPAGNPVFSLEANQTYIFNVPGSAQGDTGPFVRAVGGGSNESRLSCLVQTTTEVLDAVPGAPGNAAQVIVDLGRTDLASLAVLVEILKQVLARNVLGGADDFRHAGVADIQIPFLAALALEAEPHLGPGEGHMAVAKGGQAVGPVLLDIAAVADADHGVFQQPDDRGQNLFGGQATAAHVLVHLAADPGQGGREFQHVIVFRTVAHLAEIGVIAVLLAPLRIAPRRKDVAARVGAEQPARVRARRVPWSSWPYRRCARVRGVAGQAKLSLSSAGHEPPVRARRSSPSRRTG